MARFRVHEKTREAVNDAAFRYGLKAAEVYRRAVTAYQRHSDSVNLSEFGEVCTRENSVVVTAARLNLESIERGAMEPVVRWYLAKYDDGGSNDGGMNAADYRQNPDGTFTYTGAIPPDA